MKKEVSIQVSAETILGRRAFNTAIHSSIETLPLMTSIYGIAGATQFYKQQEKEFEKAVRMNYPSF